MKNYHNQSDNARYYIICCVSFWGQVFCISLVSYYHQSEITHTWRKAHIFLWYAHIFVTLIYFFFLIIFVTSNEIYNTCCVAIGNLRRYILCLLQAPFARGAFQWSWQANNKSINHGLCTSNLVGVTVSLLLATGQQWESEEGTKNAFQTVDGT